MWELSKHDWKRSHFSKGQIQSLNDEFGRTV